MSQVSLCPASSKRILFDGFGIGSQLTKSGVFTTLRFLFAKIRVSECYGDVSTTMI